jgi:hypothetical protein
MKTTIILTIFLSLSLSLQAQFTKKDSAIGVTFSGLGDNSTFRREKNIIGGGNFWGEGFYSFGIIYIRPLSSRFNLETGVEYSSLSYRFSNASLGLGNRLYNTNLSLIEVPAAARFKFWQYFFLNGGLLLTYDATGTPEDKQFDNQAGIGAMLGAGIKYDFRNVPIGLFLNPYMKYRPLLPFAKENYHWRTTENGFRIGAVYNL